MNPHNAGEDGGTGAGPLRQLALRRRICLTTALAAAFAFLFAQLRLLSGLGRDYRGVGEGTSTRGGGRRGRPRRGWGAGAKRNRGPGPIIYDDVGDVPELVSSGPRVVNPSKGGLYEFNDVCLTRHHKESTLRGLVYLIPPEDSRSNNKLRCVPCSAPLDHKGGWYGTGVDEESVGHMCGFETVHVMYASSPEDWSRCVSGRAAREKFALWDQHQVPSRAERVHYWREPVFSLNFYAENIGHSLFDAMLVWLPHWDAFRSRGEFPFEWILSESIRGCVTEGGSSAWFCEILRAIEAFGDDPRELPLPPDNTTLYCYKSLYMYHHSQQRHLKGNKHEPEYLPKGLFDEFRDILFERFGLRRRRHHHQLPKRKNTTKLLFYAHKASGRRVWNGMDDLISNLKLREGGEDSKYADVEFDVVRDFNLPVAEQARLFNEADAFVMAHGAQMANSIFAVDGGFFVELGCWVPTYIGEPRYMDLINGRFDVVEECMAGSNDAAAMCVVCNGEGDQEYKNFTMLFSKYDRCRIWKIFLDNIVSLLENS